MQPNQSLDAIRVGEASAAEASALLRGLLPDATVSVARAVYAALRAWTWRALEARRRDPELGEWFALLHRTAAALSGPHPSLAERIIVLHELVDQSIATARMFPAEAVVRKRHVGELLALLARTQGGAMERVEIGAALKLRQANLSRVLSLAVYGGLVERVRSGREAVFQLTAIGARAAAGLPADPALAFSSDTPAAEADPRSRYTATEKPPARKPHAKAARKPQAKAAGYGQKRSRRGRPRKAQTTAAASAREAQHGSW